MTQPPGGSQERILKALYRAVEQVNRSLPAERRLPAAPGTVLSSGLDSLGLVNFIVAAEEELMTEFGAEVNLADQQAIAQEPSPFRTLQTLADYAAIRLGATANG
jgi:hypothetical protein